MTVEELTMKKNILPKKLFKYFACVLAVALTAVSFSSCGVSVTPEDAWTQFESAVEKSLKSEIYYHKTTRFTENGNFNTKVNVHCNADNEGLIMNPDGSYQNFAVYIEEYKDSVMTNAIVCGNSKSSKGGEDKNICVKKNYSDGKFVDADITEMKAEDYVKSPEFEKYSLTKQLQELEFLEYSDIDFEKTEKLSFKKNGTVLLMDFSLKDSYFERYEKSFGKESVLKGSYVQVEISYGRIAKVIVYEKETLDSNFSSYEEIYRFEVVYLGKNIYVPAYDDEEMKYKWQNL